VPTATASEQMSEGTGGDLDEVEQILERYMIEKDN